MFYRLLDKPRSIATCWTVIGFCKQTLILAWADWAESLLIPHCTNYIYRGYCRKQRSPFTCRIHHYLLQILLKTQNKNIFTLIKECERRGKVYSYELYHEISTAMYSTYTISPIGMIPFQLTFLVRQMHHLISASFRRSVQSCAVSLFKLSLRFHRHFCTGRWGTRTDCWWPRGEWNLVRLTGNGNQVNSHFRAQTGRARDPFQLSFDRFLFFY